MNEENFRQVLIDINNELSAKDKAKTLSESFKVSFDSDNIDKSLLSRENALSYKEDFINDKVVVQFKMETVQKLIKGVYEVSDDDFNKMIGVVISENLYRAYNKWLQNECNTHKDKILA